jgi:hypothetical protein
MRRRRPARRPCNGSESRCRRRGPARGDGTSAGVINHDLVLSGPTDASNLLAQLRQMLGDAIYCPFDRSGIPAVRKPSFKRSKRC